jgi:transcriptional antiterminator
MKRAYERAIWAIAIENPICFEVAKEYGKLFCDVKHLRWFILAVAERLG